MRKIFKEIIRLAKVSSKYHEMYDLTDGNAADFLEHAETEDYKKYDEKNKELEAYLSGLSFNQIKEIQVIMYLGRDEDYEKSQSLGVIYADQRNYFDQKGWVDKSTEINVILEKMPLADYLEVGLDILEIEL